MLNGYIHVYLTIQHQGQCGHFEGAYSVFVSSQIWTDGWENLYIPVYMHPVVMQTSSIPVSGADI